MFVVMFIALLAMLALSVPIAWALGLSSGIAMVIKGFPTIAVAQSLFANINSFPLMAVPFFMLAGDLMLCSGISRRLVNLAKLLVGNMSGGLGAVVVVTCMFFATLSGSSSATAAAIGSIMIPSMIKEGYDRRFAASIVASSAELGVIIPPSIPMVIYGVSAGVSVGQMFIAGFTPGILIGATLIMVVYLTSRQKGYRGADDHYSFGEKMKIVWEAVPALVLPVIILGGIYGGIFTPTEAAAIAVAYSFVMGLVNRELKPGDIIKVFGESGVNMSIILIIVANAAAFAWVLTWEQIPQTIGLWMVSFSQSAVVFLVLVNIFLFLVGMFMETLASIVIIAPVLAPIAVKYGIDPLHFGIIMIVNLAVGMVTPPVGVNLFVSCNIAKIRLDEIAPFLVRFLFILVVDVFIISYVPEISLWLPALLK